MSDDLTTEEEVVLERLLGSHPPLGLSPSWESELRAAIAREGERPVDELGDVIELNERPAAPTRFTRLLAVAAAVVVIVGGGLAATVTALQDDSVQVGVGDFAEAAFSVSADRDGVTINGEPLAAGAARQVAPGDTVAVDQSGAALVSLTTPAFEIEMFRNARLTVPNLTQSSTVTVPLTAGQVIVRLNPTAGVTVVFDTGDRQFTTKTADTELAMCQSPEGASCLAVIRGSVEWREEGVGNQVYEGGQAAIASRGNLPLSTFCADGAAVGAMQQTLRSADFVGTLADIVATWNVCPGQRAGDPTAVVLPSAAGMAHVTADPITVGSPSRTLDGSADFYIEPVTVTNALFRAWIFRAAGDTAAMWRRLAPADWLDRAPGGAATQATYADGTADQPVEGVSYDAASEYCASQGKRLPTEVEWELAATTGVLTDLADEAQDWASDWEAYGSGPTDAADRQVLRGTDGDLKQDPYFRTFAPTTPDATAARSYARIRCAADQVAIGGRTFPTVVAQDDFNGPEWPTTGADGFELGYHPEAYHLDVSRAHSQLAVVRALPQPLPNGRVDVAAYIERNNTGTGTGEHRFGLVVGSSDQLYVLSVQPDEVGRTSFQACLTRIEPALADELGLTRETLAASSPGRFAALGPDSADHGQDCSEATEPKRVPVSTIDSPLELSLVLADGRVEAWVNDVLVATTDQLPAIEIYGFLSQNYNRNRSHLHIDQVVVTTE